MPYKNKINYKTEDEKKVKESTMLERREVKFHH